MEWFKYKWGGKFVYQLIIWGAFLNGLLLSVYLFTTTPWILRGELSIERLTVFGYSLLCCLGLILAIYEVGRIEVGANNPVHLVTEETRNRLRSHFNAYKFEFLLVPSSFPVGLSTRLINSSKERTLPDLTIKTSPGFIYIMRRADGIYKLGKSTNPIRRLIEHIRDYGQKFEIVRRFVVPDVEALERLALQMTIQYQHSEDGRIELRQMSEAQLLEFIKEFERICKEMVTR